MLVYACAVNLPSRALCYLCRIVVTAELTDGSRGKIWSSGHPLDRALGPFHWRLQDSSLTVVEAKGQPVVIFGDYRPEVSERVSSTYRVLL